MQKQLNDAQDAEEEVNSSGADGSDQTYTDCDEQDEEIDAPLDAFGKPPWDREAGGSCKKLGGAARFRKGHGHRTRGGNEAVLSEEEIQGLLAEMTGVADQPEARCFGVQASHASDSSVTLSWRPPDKALGVDLLRYEVQQACLAEAPGRIDSGCGGVRRVTRGAVEQVSGLVSGLASGQDEATEGLKWVPILNQVDMLGRDLGTVCYCGWVVHGLCKDRFYRFRVRVKNCGAYGGWSAPSRPFCIGGRCFSPVGSGVGGDSWTSEEEALFMSLDTPAKVQDYLDTIPMNQEVNKDVSLSALEAVRQNHAHCLEGAILGAYILGLHGYGSLVLTPPDRAYRHLPLFPVVRARDADPAVRRGPGWQLMDLRASIKDDDHVITPFRCHGRFGALSVSNHASLRFRNPVYRSLRELSMSYFDDYMNGDGLRTLRCYSLPMDLDERASRDWLLERGDEGSRAVAHELDELRHMMLFERREIKQGLRPADRLVLRTTVAQREWQVPANADEEAQQRNHNR